jgi:hypothetical protein
VKISRIVSAGLLAALFISAWQLRAVTAADAPTAAAGASAEPGGVPLFSEDFESGKIDPTKWQTTILGAATVTVQQEKVANGKYALKVHYPAGPRAYAFIVATTLPAELKDHMFGRVNMMIDPGLQTGHTVLMFAGTPNWPISDFLELGSSKGTWQPSYQQNDTATVPTGATAPRKRAETVKHTSAIPMGKWFSLEFEFNNKPDTITTWVDGQKADGPTPFSMSGEGDTGLLGGFVNFAVGTRIWSATTQPYDVYYDDIALGTSRLGAAK